MKKVLISLAVVILVVIVGIVAVLAYIGFTSDGSSEEIFGTWAVAFRFVDDEGKYKYVENDESNKHGECKDEYVVFDKKMFTHYKQGRVNMETAIKYTGSTGVYEEFKDSTNLSLRSFGRMCFFVLDKYSNNENEDEAGLYVQFYGANCMTLCYGYGHRILAVLIKCEHIGDEIDGTNKDSIVGKWAFRGSQFDGDKQLSDYMPSDHMWKTTKNGLLVLYGEEKDSTATINNKQVYSEQRMYIYVYAKQDYIIELKVTSYGFPGYRNDKKAVCGDLVRLFLRNGG